MAIRTLTIPAQIITQGINHVVHYPNERISFYVGIMEADDLGNLHFVIGQQFKTVIIDGDKYTQFMTDHPNGYTVDDLWAYVS